MSDFIYGIQKLSLLDFPGKLCCTVFTGGCDFRCPFCHNSTLVTRLDPSTSIPQDEILSFLETRRGKLDGVAITGGEPLLHPQLPEFIHSIREMGFEVKLDTNGAHPEALEKIIDSGEVSYYAMDIKNSPEKYALTVGIEGIDLDNIKKSIMLLMDSGVEYEFRTTVVKELHENNDFIGIGEMIRGAKAYYLQKFVDSGMLIGSGFSAHDDETMRGFISIITPFVDFAAIRGE